MAYILGNVPFFDCYVRREYTRAFKDGHGEFLKGVAHAVRCIRGNSLMFQVVFSEQWAGCSFTLPIEAVVWKPCDKHDDMTYVQPWDCFSSDFGVCEFDMMKRGAVEVLPHRVPGQYRFTIDWTGSDLADHFEQHKHLHVVFLDSGLVGAFPNNRLLWSDPAFWQTTTEKPDFESLAGEFRAEGNQHLFRASVETPTPALNGAAGHH